MNSAPALNMLADNTDSKRKYLIHSALLILVGVVVYANSFTVPFILDDHYSIVYFGKRSLAALLLHGSVRPIADLTFALNYQMHGVQVVGYHLVNLFIHLCTALLFYALTHSALSALRMSYDCCYLDSEEPAPFMQWLPFAGALLFISHPIQTQAVTYIIQRYTSLATSFYLLSALLFMKARLIFLKNGQVSWLAATGALTAGLLAIGCKQIAATLPFMLIMLELFLFRSRLFTRRLIMVSGVLLLMTCALAALMIRNIFPDGILLALQHATTEDFRSSRTGYFLTQLPVVANYVRLLCFPVGQSLIHDPPTYSSLFAVPVLASLALHLTLGTMAIVLFRLSALNLKGGKPSGIYQRLASLGIAWFYVAMAVESSIFPITDSMNEHRLYLPSVGFFLATTALAALVVKNSRKWQITTVILLVGITIILGTMTIMRNRIWNDPLILWQEAAHIAPKRWITSANLANEYTKRNLPENALPLYLRALELNPNMFFRSKIGLGNSLTQLGSYAFRHTSGEELISHGGTLDSGIIAAADKAQWDAVIYNNMGLAYEHLRDLPKARQAYEAALTANPDYDLALLNLALLASRQGDVRRVKVALQRLNSINKTMSEELAKILKSSILR